MKNSICLCWTGSLPSPSLPVYLISLECTDEKIHLHVCICNSASAWIVRRVIWTSDCIYIARMGEENIIDSIPLAEADLITVSKEDDQYAKNKDLGSPIRGNQSATILDSTTSQTELGEVASTRANTQQAITASFKRINTSKIFNHPSEQHKSEEGQAMTVLQISTISEGFNSGPYQIEISRLA